jgi:hypothetical protein
MATTFGCFIIQRTAQGLRAEHGHKITLIKEESVAHWKSNLSELRV